MAEELILKSQNVHKVIKNFRKLIIPRILKNSVNMAKSSVHLCGTTHCHGGWYAVATQKFFYLLLPLVNYTDGARKMAEDLGFKNYRQMTDWLSDHPEIWGNRFAEGMFSDKMAFYHPIKRPKGAMSLNDIIDHWNDVYLRLKQIEEIQNSVPVYENITKELSELPVVEEVPDKIIVPEMV